MVLIFLIVAEFVKTATSETEPAHIVFTHYGTVFS